MIKLNHSAYYRPIKECEYDHVPFALRSVGHYRATCGWREKPIVKDFIELFWGIAGEGEFQRGNTRYVLPAEHVFLYRRGERHVIKALSHVWEYRWFTIDGPLAAAFARELGFPEEPFFAGHCPEEHFLHLENVCKDPTPAGLLNSCLAAHATLRAAKAGSIRKDDDDGLVEKYMKLVEENFADEALNVDTAAARLGIHRTTLSRLFKVAKQTSPGVYLRRVRIQKAMRLLRKENLPVFEIACRVGIPDQCYFCKLIKQTTGMSPSAFRKQ